MEWNKKDVQSLHSARRPICKWEKPASGRVKVNCDAAYDASTGNGGWGCVVCDDDGDVVSARRGRVEYLMSALHGELIGAIHGAQAAADLGVGHVIVETDAVEVVQAVYSQDFYLSPVAFLVEELRGLLEMNFISWRVQQRPRSCNRVAHELAILGSLCEPDVDILLHPSRTSLPVLSLMIQHFLSNRAKSSHKKNTSEDKLNLLANSFNCVTVTFPFTYLGNPLSTSKPLVADFLPLVTLLQKQFIAMLYFSAVSQNLIRCYK